VTVLSDISNPGNQMLRKMGWTEGQGLGRDGGGMEEAVGVKLAESGAGAGGRRVTGVGADKGEIIPPIEYGGRGVTYKESLLRAAKARYDFAQ
jgi:hypothetical protein